MSSRRSLVLLLALLLFSAVAYFYRLDRSPAYLQSAEVEFGLQARSIARSGHDINGRLLPLYFQMPDIGDDVWFHPVLVYWTTPWLWVLPFSEESVRAPTVAIALLDILLTYFVALKLWGRRDLGLYAACFMALTPAHFIHSRLAMDYVHPVPFILAWLWLLADYRQTKRESSLLAACGVLGCGVYSYIASVAMMPLYLGASAVSVWLVGRLAVPVAARMFVAFALPLSMAIGWLAFHPAVIGATLGRYSVKSAALHSFWRIQEFFRFHVFQEFVSVFWDFFNPGYLFFSGGSNYMNTTRQAGVFLLPFAIFLVAGIHRAWTVRRTPVGFLLLFGFFTAPLAAAYIGESRAIDRHLGTLPFGALLGAYGFEQLRHSSSRAIRAMAIMLLVGMPLQFAFFYADYMDDYRLRSSGAFDYNVRGVAEALLERTSGNTRILVARTIPSARAHWQFVVGKAGRDELKDRIEVFDPTVVDVATFPPGSLVAGNIGDHALTTAVDRGALRLLGAVPEVSQMRVYAIYERPLD
jgi:4-amino-4-deoxy-L-arabinose transferase-like glycosyltransferase